MIKQGNQSLTTKFFIPFLLYDTYGLYCQFYKSTKNVVMGNMKIQKTNYLVESKVVYLNGEPIFWQDSLKQGIVLSLQKAICKTEIFKQIAICQRANISQQKEKLERIKKLLSRYCIYFKQNQLHIKYKNNVIAKLPDQGAGVAEKINELKTGSSQNEAASSTGKEIKKTKVMFDFIDKDKKQMDQFLTMIKSISIYLQQYIQLAGIVKTNASINNRIANKINIPLKKRSKKIELNKILLKFRDDLALINSKTCLVEVNNICQRNVSIVLKQVQLQQLVPGFKDNLGKNTKLFKKTKQPKKGSLSKNLLLLPQVNSEQGHAMRSHSSKQFYDIKKKIQIQLKNLMQKIVRSKEYQIMDKEFQKTNLYKVKQVSDGPCNLQVIGGVSVVRRLQKCTIRVEAENDESNQIILQIQVLGKKVLKSMDQQNKSDINIKQRFEREIDIIRYISNESDRNRYYLPNYFYLPQDKTCYYFTWHHISLSYYLQNFQKQITLQQILDICIQIVLIVIDLHSIGKGIVHRDLKPSNFIVDINGANPKIMLIDFSDSMIMDQEQANQVLSGKLSIYTTPVYCPLQASIFSKHYQQLGLIKPQIDNWSVGILIYEILNQTFPISYSSSILTDIHALWQTQFLQNMNQRKGKSLGNVQKIVQFLTFSLLKIDQSKRVQLQKILVLLLLSKIYKSQIQKVYQEYTGDQFNQQYEQFIRRAWQQVESQSLQK